MRLRPDLTEAARHRALGLIREAVYEATPRRVCAFQGRPAPCFALHGGRYVISGVPVIVDGLARALKDSLLVLFAVAVAVMALTLTAVFRSRFRLLPLAVALAAAALTFGLLELVGGSLTMASIAVLPILIGLAVDYAIQLQARYDEAVEGGASGAQAARPRGGARRRRRSPPPASPRRLDSSPSSSPRRRWFAALGCCSSPGSRSPSRWR